jgi:hypothetical protein
VRSSVLGEVMSRSALEARFLRADGVEAPVQEWSSGR